MKVRDLAYFSLHNLRRNKKRTLITAMLIAFISFLSMAILCIGISFSDNATKIAKEEILTNDIVITHSQNEAISKDKYLELREAFYKNSKAISNVYSYNKAYAIDFSFLNDSLIELTKGSFDKKYSDKSYIYLSDDTKGYELEDSYSLNINGNAYEFIVAGFYKSEMVESPYFINLLYMMKLTTINSFNIEYYPSLEGDIWKQIDALRVLMDDIEGILPLNDDLNSSVTASDSIDLMVQTKMIKAFVLIAVIFIDIILICLTIGSISNTIMISIDEKHKFYGLLKLEGMNNRNLFVLTSIELLITAIAGILFSYLILVLSSPLLLNVVNYLIELIMDYSLINSSIKPMFSYPFYVPLIFVAVFIISSLLCARKKLASFFNQSPLQIMNEE